MGKEISKTNEPVTLEDIKKYFIEERLKVKWWQIFKKRKVVRHLYGMVQCWEQGMHKKIIEHDNKKGMGIPNEKE